MSPATPIGPTSPYVFVGPTGHGVSASLLAEARVRLLPPVQRGDIPHLIGRSHAPADLVIVDGRFGDVMAVGHREILDAVDAGWRVWGLGSMGAIRAAELDRHGVSGYGRVYRYLRDTMAPDDEVAVLHGQGPAYLPLTEALVDLRSFLEALAEAQILARQDAERLTGSLASTWFGRRTTGFLLQLAHDEVGPDAAAAIRQRVHFLPEHRVKSRDLIDFLTEMPWEQLPA